METKKEDYTWLGVMSDGVSEVYTHGHPVVLQRLTRVNPTSRQGSRQTRIESAKNGDESAEREHFGSTHHIVTKHLTNELCARILPGCRFSLEFLELWAARLVG
jgi:hypothetical protein